MHATRLIEVSRRYGKRWALIRASLEVPKGSALLLTGENGAGKTTLLRVVSTALSPTRGQLEVLGLPARGNLDAIRGRVGIVTHASHFYQDLSALENLRLLGRFQPEVNPTRIPAILDRVGLADRADSPVGTFSAGMQRRLCMARVLLREPELVLLDEPFGQLDPEGVTLVEEIIRELKDGGATLIMSTHDIDRGRAVCDLHAHMSRGRLRGSVEAIGGNP